MFILNLFFGLTAIIGLLTIFRSKVIYKTYLNHYALFNVVWLTWIYLSIYLNSYLYPVDSEVYYIFLLGTLSFDFTILFVSEKRIFNPLPYYLDIRYRRILEIFCIFLYIPQAYKNFKLIQSGVPLWEINHDYWNEFRQSGSYWYLILQQNICAPATILLIATTFYSKYIRTSKYSTVITILNSLILTIIFTLVSGGGRTTMMSTLFLFLLSVLATKSKLYSCFLTDINVKKIIFFILIMVAMLQFITEGRGGTEKSFVQNIIDSYTIFAPNFEYFYKHSDVFSQYTCGASTFEFFIALLQYPFSLLFDYRFYTDYSSEYVQNFVYCQPLGKEVNARVTPFFYFMRDFGYLGIVVGPIILSWMYNVIYKYFVKNSFLRIVYVGLVLNTLFYLYNFPLNKSLFLSIIIAFILMKISHVKTNLK